MNKKRKLLSVILTLCMIISMFAGMSIGVSAESADFNPSVISGYWGDAPYADARGYYKVNYDTTWRDHNVNGIVSIASGAQLASIGKALAGTAYRTDSEGYLLDASASRVTSLSDAVLETASDRKIVSFNLSQDIDLSAYYWNPIGTASQPFGGTINGCGFTISGLTINMPGGSNVGLFGVASANSHINDLTVENAYVSGGKNTGIIAGCTYGEVKDCTTTVSDASAATCTVTSSGVSQGVGGIAGSANGASSSISNCTNNAAVTGTAATTYTGGVVGKAEGSVATCTNNGAVSGINYVGGVIGYLASTGSYSGCSSTTTPTGTGSNVGNIVGYQVSAVTGAGSYTFDDTNYNQTLTVNGNIDITVNTSNPVTIQGDNTSNAYAVSISCPVSSKITLNGIKVSSPTSTSKSIIDYAYGTTNTLTIAGENVLENDNYALNNAVIHVGASSAGTASLDIKGAGKLYIYKNAMGAGIGSNTNEANGVIKISSGSLFIKGSKTGPCIGNDTAGDTSKEAYIGNITIAGGAVDLVTKGKGAAIGGSNMSISKDVFISGGTVTLTTDFKAPVIGAGAQKSGVAANNGTVKITGGSVKSMITENGWSEWGLSAPITVPIVNSGSYQSAVTDDAIKANIVNGSNQNVYQYALGVLNFSASTIKIDRETYSCGNLNHEYIYNPSTSSTTGNWYAYSPVDTNRYIYLTGFNHNVVVGNITYRLTWNSESHTFTAAASMNQSAEKNDSSHLSLSSESFMTDYNFKDSSISNKYAKNLLDDSEGVLYFIKDNVTLNDGDSLYFPNCDALAIDGTATITINGTVTFKYEYRYGGEIINWSPEGYYDQNENEATSDTSYDKLIIKGGSPDAKLIIDGQSFLTTSATNTERKAELCIEDLTIGYTGESDGFGYNSGITLKNVTINGLASTISSWDNNNPIQSTGAIILDNCKFNNLNVKADNDEAASIIYGSNITINGLEINYADGVKSINAIYNTGNKEYAAIIKPTSNVNINGAVAAAGGYSTNVKIEQADEEHAISSVTLNGETISEYSTVSGITSGLSVTLGSSAPAAASYAASISTDKGNYGTGDTVTVTAALTPDAAESLASGSLTFSYDNSKLEFVSAIPNTAFGTDGQATGDANGSCTASFKTSSSGSEIAVTKDSALQLATFIFTAKAAGTAEFEVTSAAGSAKDAVSGSSVTLPESKTTINIAETRISHALYANGYRLVKYTTDKIPTAGNAYFIGDTALAYVPAYANGESGKYVFVMLYENAKIDDIPNLTVEEKAGSYVTINPATGDANQDMATNIVDAQVAAYIATNVFSNKTEGIDWLNTDVNGDGRVNALDAQAIQYYVHYGKFGTFS